jgi:hypothetical protein
VGQQIALWVALGSILLLLPLGGYVLWRSGYAGKEKTVEQSSPPVDGHVFNGTLWTMRGKEAKEEKVFRLTVAHDTWDWDEATRKRLEAILAIRRDTPLVLLAVAVKDYGTRKPGNAELLDEAKKRLENYFDNNPEMNDPDSKPFAGQTAQRLVFRGVRNEVVANGECYMFAYHGFGYWFYIWGTELPDAQKELKALQQNPGKGFVPVTERAGWKERRPVETFKGVGFTLQGTEGLWEASTDKNEDEPQAAMYLIGRNRTDPKDNIKNAHGKVLVLPREADLKTALKAARLFVEEHKTKVYENVKYLPATDKPGSEGDAGSEEALGDRPGRVLELRVNLKDSESAWFLLLAAVNGPDGVYALVCECRWEARELWQEEFRDLAKSLRLKAK